MIASNTGRGFRQIGGVVLGDMARNSIVKADILYKCTIDEIRLRVISHLQENYELLVHIHELRVALLYRLWQLLKDLRTPSLLYVKCKTSQSVPIN